MRLLVLLFAFLATGFAAVPAGAASFDCDKAATAFEHAICDNAELSALDERLARTYATAVGGLSPDALDALRADQRNWLTYAQRACTRNAEPLSGGSYDKRGVGCLADLFTARSRVLETSRMMEGLRFYPTGQYHALPDPQEADNPDSYWPVSRHEASMVQLDSEAAFAASLNAYIAEEAAKITVPLDCSAIDGADVSSDSTVSFTIAEQAGEGRITLLVDTYWYGHGAAHGNWTVSYRHYLVNESRAMEAGDLFTGQGWQKALLRLTVAALEDQHGEWLMLDEPRSIAAAVADPARWDFSDPYGLIIQFQPYEVAAYAYGAPTARIAWSDLEPYLAETADQVRYGY